MNNRPTPETDAALARLVKNQAGNSCDAVVIHHARRLERERDEAREALRKAIRFVEAYEPHTRGVEADQNETLSIIRKALEETK
jgi:RIO-like serine/threonine protein kinase